MASTDKVYVRKLLQTIRGAADTATDQKPYIFMQTKCDSDQIKLTMLESVRGRSYKGVITHAELREIADELELPFTELLLDCMAALTSQNLGAPGFQYCIEQTDGENADAETHFTLLKKHDHNMENYMDIKLRPIANCHELLETATDLLARTDTYVASVQAKAALANKCLNVKEQTEYKELLAAYQQCVAEKCAWKHKTLKSCTAMLNDKKRKIVELTRLLNGEYDEDFCECEGDDADGGDGGDADGGDGDAGPSTSGYRPADETAFDNDSVEDEFAKRTQPMATD